MDATKIPGQVLELLFYGLAGQWPVWGYFIFASVLLLIWGWNRWA